MREALKHLEDALTEYLSEKAPKMSEKLRKAFVGLIPWLLLLGVIIAAPAFLFLIILILGALGLGVVGLTAIAEEFGMVPTVAAAGAGTIASIPALIAMGLFGFAYILEVMAIPGLFKRKQKGWRRLYYATLILAVSNLLKINLFGILYTILWLYILFQVKAHYNGIEAGSSAS